MEDHLAVINCIISNSGSVAMVNERFYPQPGLIIAYLSVPCRDYGVSVVSMVLHGTQNQASSPAGDLGEADGVKVKPIQVPVNEQKEGNKPWNIWNGCCP